MMQRGLHDGKPDLAAPGRGGERTGESDRVDIGADPVEMVLGEPNHIDAELVGQPGFTQCLVDDSAVPLGVAAVRKQKIAEFHAGPPPSPSAASRTAFGEAVKASKNRFNGKSVTVIKISSTRMLSGASERSRHEATGFSEIDPRRSNRACRPAHPAGGGSEDDHLCAARRS